MSKVRTGCLALDMAGWQTGYFPEELPQDWQLAYYSNEYRAIVLEWSVWAGRLAQIKEQLEDVGDDFRIYFRVRGQFSLAAGMDPPWHELAEKFGGFLLDRQAATACADEDLRASSIAPLSVAGECVRFYATTGEPLPESSPVRLSAICIVEWQNLRQLRLELEKLAPLLADGDVLIWVDAEDVTAAGMQQLKTLLEIMVIA